MSGLTEAGFSPETFEEIQGRIQGKLEVINPGFDFSPESPDGQLIDIFSYEIFTMWQQLNMVYNSYNPFLASGAALRNLGQITGAPFGFANRSFAVVELTGTSGTLVPADSLVSDANGNEFYVAYDAVIPSNAEVIAKVPGPIPVPIGTITTIVTPVAGWATVAQSTEGVIGMLAMSEQKYRNLRNATVMRNYTSNVDVLKARLLELGLEQVTVFNNDAITVVSGVPANTVAVTIGEVGVVSDADIAKVIFETLPAGCPTFGATTEAVLDLQGFSHDVSFTRATAVAIQISLDVTYLDADTAGADESIKNSLMGHVNSLAAGEDVIWSRIFQYVTPIAKAQVNTMTIKKTGGSFGTSNIALSSVEFASLILSDITLVVT